MTNNKIFTILLLGLIPGISWAIAENSQIDRIDNIVIRDTGSHAIFLENTSLPNSDVCTLDDRVILEDTIGENKAMLAVALAAMLSGADVQLRTDGCLATQPGSLNTAPRVTKIKIFAP